MSGNETSSVSKDVHSTFVAEARWVGLALTSIAHFFPSDLVLSGFQGHFSHFNGLTVLETGAAFGRLHRFFKTVRMNHKEAGNCFLGFRKRAVRDHILAYENFTFMRLKDPRL